MASDPISGRLCHGKWVFDMVRKALPWGLVQQDLEQGVTSLTYLVQLAAFCSADRKWSSREDAAQCLCVKLRMQAEISKHG